jgi:hypothetical protein
MPMRKNSKTRKWPYIVLGLIILAGTVYYFFFKNDSVTNTPIPTLPGTDGDDDDDDDIHSTRFPTLPETIQLDSVQSSIWSIADKLVYTTEIDTILPIAIGQNNRNYYQLCMQGQSVYAVSVKYDTVDSIQHHFGLNLPSSELELFLFKHITPDDNGTCIATQMGSHFEHFVQVNPTVPGNDSNDIQWSLVTEMFFESQNVDRNMFCISQWIGVGKVLIGFEHPNDNSKNYILTVRTENTSFTDIQQIIRLYRNIPLDVIKMRVSSNTSSLTVANLVYTDSNINSIYVMTANTTSTTDFTQVLTTGNTDPFVDMHMDQNGHIIVAVSRTYINIYYRTSTEHAFSRVARYKWPMEEMEKVTTCFVEQNPDDNFYWILIGGEFFYSILYRFDTAKSDLSIYSGIQIVADTNIENTAGRGMIHRENGNLMYFVISDHYGNIQMGRITYPDSLD